MHYRHGVSSFWRRDLREIYRSGCQVTFSKSEKDLLYALQAKLARHLAQLQRGRQECAEKGTSYTAPGGCAIRRAARGWLRAAVQHKV